MKRFAVYVYEGENKKPFLHSSWSSIIIAKRHAKKLNRLVGLQTAVLEHDVPRESRPVKPEPNSLGIKDFDRFTVDLPCGFQGS